MCVYICMYVYIYIYIYIFIPTVLSQSGSQEVSRPQSAWNARPPRQELSRHKLNKTQLIYIYIYIYTMEYIVSTI